LDLSRRRNNCSDVDDRTSSGRLFQTAGVAAAKAWSLIMERWVRQSKSGDQPTGKQSLFVFHHSNSLEGKKSIITELNRHGKEEEEGG